MQSVQYQPTRTKLQQSTFVHKDLQNCTHVFIRRDAWKTPLQPTYDGPFRVIDRKDRYFVVSLNNSRQNALSINRLKPAYSIHTPETLTKHSSISLINISLNTLPLVTIPHHCHLQLFIPGPDVGFSGLIVSFKHFNLTHIMTLCTRSLCNSLEGELCSVSLLNIDFCNYLFVRSPSISI